jgi:formate hydrogenlyase subunit 6/NADH:ubiquinone oxidoreductase subunit I
MSSLSKTAAQILPKPRFDDLIASLLRGGFEVIGPRIEQGAIVYGPVQSTVDLPVGWTDRQEPGSYRLEKRNDRTYFGYAVGPHSWKKYLFPPTLLLWRASRTDTGFTVDDRQRDPPRRAFLGVRACELHAIAVQDRVFIDRDGRFTDAHYARARERLFIVAVECEVPAGTCFCASMGTGPQLASGCDQVSGACDNGNSPGNQSPSFDLALTELDDAFLVRAGTDAGNTMLQQLQLCLASDEQVAEARHRVEVARQSMGRTVDVTGIRNLLHRNQEHPRWQNVADRCLACTNCTLVCPTCFCSSVEDVTDLSLENAERVRRWDSCFNPEFAQVHGGNFRRTIRGRYRQWLTHKFASWFDQFDVSGCVGCGRCITWCPVGIDVTQEITAIRATDGARWETAS